MVNGVSFYFLNYSGIKLCTAVTIRSSASSARGDGNICLRGKQRVIVEQNRDSDKKAI